LPQMEDSKNIAHCTGCGLPTSTCWWIRNSYRRNLQQWLDSFIDVPPTRNQV